MARLVAAPVWTSAALLLVAMVSGPSVTNAQRAGFHLVRTPDGVTLELPPSAGWRRKAAAVAQRRRELIATGRYDALNAPGFRPSPVAVSGNLRFPTILVGYRNRTGPPAARYDSLLYHESAGPSPYTLRGFYQELSNGLLQISGRALGWYVADSAASYYLSACGSGVNAVFCYVGRSRMREAFIGALRQADDTVDFGGYDNDGPDGLPNSTDDDGFADLVQFVHPDVGGECGGPGFWAHRAALSTLGGRFITNDLRPDGSQVVIDGYTLVAGVGGITCGNSYELMAIGGAAHELGHVLDLPDLYDTNPDDGDNSAGVGEWCLMGSGNFTSPASPAHLSAWPKAQLGWVAVRELTGELTYVLPPVVSSDTVVLIRPGVENPQGSSSCWRTSNPREPTRPISATGAVRVPRWGDC